MKLLNFLFIFLLILLPLGAVIRIPFIESAYLYLIDVPIFLIFIASFYQYINTRFTQLNNSIGKAAFYFIVFCFISLLINSIWLKLSDLRVSFLYLIRLILYINLIFAVTLCTKKFRKRMIYFLTLSGFAALIFGYIQYFFYPVLRNLYYLGWDEHLYRMFSTFFDPNYFAAFLVLFAILQGGLFLQNFYLCKTQMVIFKLFMFSLGSLLTLIALFLTYSRTGLIMLLVGAATLVILTRTKRIMLWFAVFTIIGYTIIPKSITIEGFNPFRVSSGLARIQQYNNALIIFKDSPIWGIGFNAYRYAQVKYKFITENRNETHAGAGVPNSWLVILATTGIIGFGMYINFWRQILLALFVRMRQDLRNYKSVILISSVISAIIALFVGSLFENLLLYPFIMIWIYTLVGATVDN